MNLSKSNIMTSFASPFEQFEINNLIPIKLGSDANFIMEECSRLGIICILVEASDSSDTHLQKLASASI